MLPSLDNFIDFGKDVFAAKPEYRSMAVDFYETAMTNESLSSDVDRVNGCKLGEAILLNLRGHVDDVRMAQAITSVIRIRLIFLISTYHP